MKYTVFWVLEDLKFKVSEGYDQNWCFPDSAQLAVSTKLRQLTGQSQENTTLGPNLLKFGETPYVHCTYTVMCSQTYSTIYYHMVQGIALT